MRFQSLQFCIFLYHAHTKLCNALFSTVVSIFRPYSNKKMQILQPTSLVTLVHIHQKEKIEVEIATKVASVNRSFDDSKCSHQFFQLIFEALTMTMSQSVFFYFFSVMKSCIIFRNLTSNLLPSKSISFKSSAALELKKRQNSTYVFFSQGYTVVALN